MTNADERPPYETDRIAVVTPEMRRQDARRARRRAVRHWLRCQWGRTGYRPTMRLLHRMNLCWMEPMPRREGDNGQWINVWCQWCGVRGQRLDMTRVVMPHRAPALAPDAVVSGYACRGITYVSSGLSGDDGPWEQVAECDDIGGCGWRVVMSEYTGTFAPEGSWDVTVTSDEFLSLHAGHLAHRALTGGSTPKPDSVVADSARPGEIG